MPDDGRQNDLVVEKAAVWVSDGGGRQDRGRSGGSELMVSKKKHTV